ncbi:hypothetical protein BAE44_0021903 [Dichanthelium oligosanthes]|uniref:AIPP2-like SPOC-like domain-containing protein n=1 Tax=Dichanthelium oligosanthes TaxID=888268 RepID=A0A1E5UW70_9POAL|nr:hypothetical protein BAE44_0021903 [Dichanthelium oligosanthes]
MESSHPTHSMESLIHKAKNVDSSNLNNGALGSRAKGQSNSYQGEDIDVGRMSRKIQSRSYNEDGDNGGDQHAMVVEHDEGVHLENLTSVLIMKRERCIETNEYEVDGGYQNAFGVENDWEGVDQSKTYKSKKKQRRDIELNKYEADMCDQHRMHVEDGTSELTQVAISKHGVQRQCCCCSEPIDKPSWSGLFKIDGKEYISLAGHFWTKSCEKVRELSLPSVVQVTKVPRLAAWPKIWKASKPTAFQTEHYLWATFRAKVDKAAATGEQEEDKGNQHVSSQLDEVQSEESDKEMILMKCGKPLENQQLPATSIQEAETCYVQGPTNVVLEREAPEERRLRDSLHEAICNSASATIATNATTVANAATVPSEATSFAVDTSAFPANQGPMDPSMEVCSCSSSIFDTVVRPGPKVQQFIQEMERDGGLVAVMQGEAIGASQWTSKVISNNIPHRTPLIRFFNTSP